MTVGVDRCGACLTHSVTWSTGSSRSPTTWGRPTCGTRSRRARAQEVDFLVGALGLRTRACGCSTSAAGRAARPRAGPAGDRRARHRHQRALRRARPRRRPAGATFERLDARALPFDAEFDAVICLCQGAFGLMTADGDDEAVLAGMARAAAAGRPAGPQRVQRLLRGEVLGRRRRSTPRRASTTSAPRSATRPGSAVDDRPLDRLLHAARAAAALRGATV